MKKYLLIFTLIAASQIAFAKTDWGRVLKGIGNAENCAQRGGDIFGCAGNEVERSNPTKAQSLTMSYGSGQGNSGAECEENAKRAAEEAAIFKCTQDFGRSCSVMPGRTLITQPPRDNPAVTIGGLSGKRLDCTATAAAQVDR